ncbi:MAG TPA: hypothetical protein VEQ59_22860 [Polyangiaceae bacterium]|nr:hypothetical protein [Polyangiaceae bacterium]
MSRRGLLWLLCIAPLGCEARDVTVFEVSSGGDVARSGRGGAESSAGSDQQGGNGSKGGADNVSGADIGGTDNGGGDSGGPSMSGSGGSAGAAGASGGSSSGEQTCASNKDCPQDWYCEKVGCSAASGACALRPKRILSDYAPVCGCDGVTYWNDVVRRQLGQALFEDAPCSTTARVCNFGPDCGLDFMSCSRLASPGESCGSSPQGVCWTLPPNCPDPKNDPDVWQDCRPPSSSGAPPCLDTCNAIRIERPQQKPTDPKSMCPAP